MTLQPNDLILEIIGTPKNPLQIPNALETEIWSDARIGDATLHIRLESATYASAALEYIKAQGLTPIGARVIQAPSPLVTRQKPQAKRSFFEKFARAA
jgi:hypothetical protein